MVILEGLTSAWSDHKGLSTSIHHCYKNGAILLYKLRAERAVEDYSWKDGTTSMPCIQEFRGSHKRKPAVLLFETNRNSCQDHPTFQHDHYEPGLVHLITAKCLVTFIMIQKVARCQLVSTNLDLFAIFQAKNKTKLKLDQRATTSAWPFLSEPVFAGPPRPPPPSAESLRGLRPVSRAQHQRAPHVPVGDQAALGQRAMWGTPGFLLDSLETKRRPQVRWP